MTRSASDLSVSVLMPMRNPGVYLRAAIGTVLSQEHELLELIVVDDGSTDGSGDLIRRLGDPRIRLLDGPRSGIAACMNVALAASTGEIVMRCDADDLYPPGRIRHQLRWLASHPEHGAVCGPFSAIDRSGNAVSAFGPWPSEALPDAVPWMLSRGLTHLCSFAIRREAMLRVGRFRDFFETAEDIDYVLRLAQQAAIAFLPENTYLYRLHNDSITHTQPTLRREFFESMAYEMAVERKRVGSDALMRGRVPIIPDAGGGSSGQRAHRANTHIASLLVGQAWHRHELGDAAGACGHAWRALCADKRSWPAWKTFALVWLRRATSGRAPR